MIYSRSKEVDTINRSSQPIINHSSQPTINLVKKIKTFPSKIKILKKCKKNRPSFVPNHPNPEWFGRKRQCERISSKSTSSDIIFPLIRSGILTPAPNGFSHVSRVKYFLRTSHYRADCSLFPGKCFTVSSDFRHHNASSILPLSEKDVIPLLAVYHLLAPGPMHTVRTTRIGGTSSWGRDA